MNESTLQRLITGLKKANINFVCELPDSWLAPLIQRVKEDPAFDVVTATNEGEGVAICAGAWLGGRRPVMIMENSGLRMACEELARLALSHQIPVFMILSYRGDLGDPNFFAQPHAWTMIPVLDALRAEYRVLHTDSAIEDAILDAQDTMAAAKTHVALILSKQLCRPRAEAIR